MAYAVIGGLVVATLLTLVFLPALYVAWFRIQPAQNTRAASGSDPEHNATVTQIVDCLKGRSASPDPALHEA
jgi:hypothetical protein